jgi:glyoxylase-like metal-dependent hydrolase (beta-lactamase superfamily II)
MLGSDALYDEIAPGRYLLRGVTGRRALYTYLVRDGGDALLIDSGEAGTALTTIIPVLGQLQVEPSHLRQIAITHPDADHQGGAAQLVTYAPGARILCGFEDRAMVADPKQMLQQRYRAYVEHGLDFNADEQERIRQVYGSPVMVARALVGGERLRVGAIELLMHHGPGHAAGHLMLEDREIGALFMSDAVHGRCSPALDGAAALPPTYEDVDAYLGTIAAVRALDPKQLFSGHFPPMRGAEIDLFLDLSVQFVSDFDELILDELHSGPADLRGICEAAADRFGPFLAGEHLFMFAAHGHLRRLARRDRIRAVERPDRPPVFALDS